MNIKVGSLRGTRGEDDTISWPFSAKKFRKVDLISLTPLMFIQSGVLEHDPEKWEAVFRKDHAQTIIAL
ncbi:hypothetical protein GCM10010987_22810 [Bradyrhizobium guangdongense]|uniref:Uncharacterized protein n=1 Tax=Bradyrhizobium guangdongense TaxID=1325090 RepID=A0AA88B7I2_9BRAD|nr:hypothetical protein GCM10010987_22810 [Bradyrhizobium guangdongense]